MRKLLLLLLIAPLCTTLAVGCGGSQENTVVPLPDDYDEAAETAQEEAALDTTQ